MEGRSQAVDCSLPEHQNELWWHLLGGRSRSRSLMSNPSGVICLRVCMHLCSSMPDSGCACVLRDPQASLRHLGHFCLDVWGLLGLSWDQALS